MNLKPLPQNKAKERLEALIRNHRDVEVYDAKKLSASELREALKGDHVWLMVGKTKWS